MQSSNNPNQQQQNRSISGPLSNQTRDEQDDEEEEGPVINPTQQSQKVCHITAHFTWFQMKTLCHHLLTMLSVLLYLVRP